MAFYDAKKDEDVHMTKKLRTALLGLGGTIALTITGSYFVFGGGYYAAHATLRVLDPIVRIFMLVAVAYSVKACIFDERIKEKEKRRLEREAMRAEFKRQMAELDQM